MIRKFESRELDAVMQIWLNGNLDAHPFIPASFWTDHFETVRDMLPQAELYVHENEAPRQIDGLHRSDGEPHRGDFRCKIRAFQGHWKSAVGVCKVAQTALNAERLSEKRAGACVLPA